MSIASSKSAVNPDGIAPHQLQVRVNQAGEVDMATALPPLADYLRNHSQWIEHSFKPLRVFPRSQTAYELQFFRMGGLGFELEPCFVVEVGSEGDRLFFLRSIEQPSEAERPYAVDCQSFFRLEERTDTVESSTRIYWTLHLDITIHLPGFLQALPRKRVRAVAEAVANQVARRMCLRLNHNVCNDFYRYAAQKTD
jgi:hypothetical protein